MDNISNYFLGANTEQGFVSLFEEFCARRRRVYILKGGPGTGKSTLMRRLADAASARKLEAELLHCSSDPDSLDGVWLPGPDVALLDGTPPHVLEPPYPGVHGFLIDLYRFWDTDTLKKNGAQIKKMTATAAALYERACLYLGAAGKLNRDVMRIGEAALDRPKMRGYTERLCNKYLKAQNKPPAEERRFAGAITPDGAAVFSDQLERTEKTIVFDDAYGLSWRILEQMRARALKNGHRITCCLSPLSGQQPEHIIFHDISLTAATSNFLCRLDAEPYCRVNLGRFLDPGVERAHSAKLSFLKRSRGEIIAQAAGLLDECRTLHARLEECYTPAVDFAALDGYTDELIGRLLGEL